MRTVVASHELLPKGLELESLSVDAGHVSVHVESGRTRGICPICGHGSSRVHSRYHRTVSDLPWHGICVTFKIRVRRFFCDKSSCERRIFCERLEEVAARAHKTSRLEEALLAIALELGGRAGRQVSLGAGNCRRTRHFAQEDQGCACAGDWKGQGARRGRLRVQERLYLWHYTRRS